MMREARAAVILGRLLDLARRYAPAERFGEELDEISQELADWGLRWADRPGLEGEVPK